MQEEIASVSANHWNEEMLALGLPKAYTTVVQTIRAQARENKNP